MKQKTLSFGKGKGNVRHNNREYITDNVDKNRVADNIVYVQQDLRDAYAECFQASIDDYNAGQTRKDRMKSLDGYMDEIKRNQANKNGEKLFYEQVVGIGDMYDSGILTNPEDAQTCKEILDEYAQSFQERNPHLHVFNMVLHMDESTPHLHIDYIPVAEGYKQGLPIRNSLSKALENQGLKSARQQKDNNTISWQNRERTHITEMCKERGIEIVSLGVEREDMTLGQYKENAIKMEKHARDIEKQEIKTVNLPFGFRLETPGQAKVIEQELERKTHMAKAEEAFNVAEQKLDEATDKVKETVKATTMLHRQAELDRKAAEEYKQLYEDKYYEQEDLNIEVAELRQQIIDRDKTIDSLTVDNKQLQADVDRLKRYTDRAVLEAVTPLKTQIEGYKDTIRDLKDRLDGVCQSLANVTKAFGMLRYDREDGYQVTLNSKQTKLFDALEKYTTKWLRHENKEDMAVDVEKHIGLSEGITKEIKALEPKRDLDRGR